MRSHHHTPQSLASEVPRVCQALLLSFVDKRWLLLWFPVLYASWASLVAEMVKNLPAMQETCVLSLGWKDPLEKGMATHSSILAWRIPWTEEPDRLLKKFDFNKK